MAHIRLRPLRIGITLGALCGVVAACAEERAVPGSRAATMNAANSAHAAAPLSPDIERTARRSAEPSATVRGPVTASPEPAADSTTAEIRGRVLVRDVGLGGVPVTLSTPDGVTVRTASFVGRDDQRGFFAFRSVPPGEYDLTLDLPERSGVEFRDTARTVEVKGTSPPVRVAFSGRLKREARVEGTVVDEVGRPMENVRVSLRGDALEGYPTDLVPTLDSLAWATTVTTDAHGRYAIDAPPGWYHLIIWREEWINSLAFTRYQYRSANPVLAPGESDRVHFDFREFAREDCTVGRLAYGDGAQRGEEAMRCGEALHPTVTRYELWAFDGHAGDEVSVEVRLDGRSPLLLMGPDSTLLAADHGEPGVEDRRIGTMLEKSGTHYIVVTHAAPAWRAPDRYELALERTGRTALASP